MIEDLIGRMIVLKNTRYRVTDVHHADGGPMVYAQQVGNIKGPARAAFYVADIQGLIQANGGCHG